MATTYDKASLVMIPSGYKDDKLYAVKPTDGSGDFTFSRDGAGASPATRVNASGLIEKGRENVLLQSNAFTTSPWAASVASITGGQPDKDGGNTAWLLSKTGISYGGIYQTNTLTAGVWNISLYMKAGTNNKGSIRLSTGGLNDIRRQVNLTTGAIATASASTANPIAESATDVGGGWWRFSFCGLMATSTITINVYAGDTADTSGNIYIQDAQLEQGLVATDYIETTTAPVSAGLLGDMPRLDYSGGATCPSLLLEPSRVNVITQSEYIDGLSKTGVTITANETTSPEGVVNASKVAYASGAAYFVGGSSLTTGTDYTFSGFFKADESNYVIVNQAGAGAKNAFYNLADGTHSGASGITTDMIDYGNGWYRIIYTDNLLYDSIRIYMSGNGSYGNYPSVGEGFFAWGFQTEQGSYPTSYIPTYGSASTRGADLGYVTGISDLIGQTEGTIFAEFEIPQDFTSTADHRFTISDGSPVNWIFVSINNIDNIRIFHRTNNISNIDTSETGVISHGTTYKVAFAYKSGSTSCYLNGIEILSSSSTFPAPTSPLSQLGLTGDSSTTTASPQVFGLNIKQRLQFKTRLTNAELAAITSL